MMAETPTPTLIRIDDPQEKKAFNRYIALLYCANVGLAPRCHGLGIVTDELERAAERVRLLEQAAGVLEEDHGLTASAPSARLAQEQEGHAGQRVPA